ncbi:ChaB family protein [Candidatus Odyssella thessalonicensis]|uniref:ChaB family protein n=1 Tax=Candidatus Odyssella thessalonicensis TaxID=84647 RepID=UPI000225B219|nr:ChaB family protein [Candidatus Odyssella thessalonicensis]
MPYATKSDLPSSVRDHLPPHAQDIYLQAFNHAWEEYQNPEKRRQDSSQEETAHKVAWAAVKKQYTKQDDTWVPRSNS